MVLCLAWVGLGWVWGGRVKAQGSAAFMPRLSGLCWIIKVTQPVAELRRGHVTWTLRTPQILLHVPRAPPSGPAEKVPESERQGTRCPDLLSHKEAGQAMLAALCVA